MIKAFLFDVDGVLADTMHISVGLTMEFYRTKGYTLTEEIVKRHLGVGMKELFAGPGREIGVTVDHEEAMAFFRARYKDALYERTPALPGAAEIVHMAKKAGVLCAVASSAPRWRVEANLEAVGIQPGDMDLIVSGGDVKRNKPYGDIYQHCLIQFGLDGKEALVFEDAAGGIRSGKNAGCWVCGLTTTVDRATAKANGADAVIEDLSHFPLFHSLEELDDVFKSLRRIGPGAMKYGANWVTPLERKMPWDFIMKKAIEDAFAAKANAYTPYSGVKIGAAVLSAASGRIYSGCNVENAAFGSTICAERNAMTTAVANEGVVGFDLIVVVSDMEEPAQPCGSCRQMMSEFCRPETPIVLVSSKGTRRDYVFSDLLPCPFEFPEA